MANNVFQRHELKYLISRKQKEALTLAMSPYMFLDGYGHYQIQNIYYDTQSNLLIRRSLEKPIYKEKLRVRCYGLPTDDANVFVEIKKKFDGIVYKRRVSMLESEATSWLNGEINFANSQICREINYFKEFYKNLLPAVYLSYEREAFAMHDKSDFRVTFDNNILYRTDNINLHDGVYGISLLNYDTVLMEIKTSSSIPLWMVHALSQYHIYQTSFSKYGNAYLQLKRGD